MPSIAELAVKYSARLVGDGQVEVTGLSPLGEASPHQLAFLANPLYRKDALSSQAGCLIVSEADYEFLSHPENSCKSKNFLVTQNPYAVFARISQGFEKASAPSRTVGIHPTAVIEESAVIAESASIGPFCYIGKNSKVGANTILKAHVSLGDDASIGDDALIYPNVSIYHDCHLGDRVIVHSGTVIGSDGFGFAPDLTAGEWVKVPQIGKVMIGHDVEIGSNTSVDRGALGDTVIEDGCKIDNLVQIAHNVHIGSLTVIAGNTAIAGSTRIGKMCMIGGSSSFSGHLTIADRTTVSGGTTIIRSIDQPDQHYTSIFPMLPHADWEKNAAILRSLDKMRARVKELEKQLKLIK